MSAETTHRGGFRGHRPTGATSWPLILVAGAPKTGKSYTVAELTGSDLIGETYWIEVGEPTAEEYGKVPGARYILADHDGTFNDILHRVREAIAEPTRNGKPNLIVIDSVTLIWEMISTEMQDVANRRRKADIDAETKITNDLWNIAKARWKKLIRLLKTHNGPVVVVARLEVVAVMDASGQPTKDKTQKVQAHKSLPYDVDVIVQIPEYRRYQITGVRSLVFSIAPGEKLDAPSDFTLDGLLRKMGLAELGVAAPRQFVELVPSAQDAMAEFSGPPQDRPAQRPAPRADNEWNTATGQPLTPPAPTMPTVTEADLNEIARLLKLKRGAVNGDRKQHIEQLVRRAVPDPWALSQSEARDVIETLTAEEDKTPPAAEAAPAGPAPVGTPDNPAITAPQQKALHALLNKAGYGDRAKGLDLLVRYVGHPLESSAKLSKAEASTVIDKLSNGELPAPPAAPEPSGPAPSDEGISEFDVLDQMILDINGPKSLMDVHSAIAAELQRGTITASDAELLGERIDVHLKSVKAGV